MESEKLPGFSEDGDHHQEKTEEGSRCKRSYECVFCKRGFTNAQALGGHMNIHRKHRSSSKSSSSSSSKQLLNPNPNPSVTRFITRPFPFETLSDSWEALRNKLSTTTYYPIHGNDHTYPILVSSSSNELGSDLTLQIGSSCPKSNEEEEEEMDQDIDLELRLGRAHHP